jgi:hypothetical protein
MGRPRKGFDAEKTAADLEERGNALLREAEEKRAEALAMQKAAMLIRGQEAPNA